MVTGAAKGKIEGEDVQVRRTCDIGDLLKSEFDCDCGSDWDGYSEEEGGPSQPEADHSAV